MEPLMLIGIILIGAVILAVVLVIIGLNAPEAADPIQARLAEFSSSDEVMTLEDIEMSLRFHERVVLPLFNRIGEIASRFTPQATLQNARRRLEMAGNPMQLDPAFFLLMRMVMAVVFGGSATRPGVIGFVYCDRVCLPRHLAYRADPKPSESSLSSFARCIGSSYGLCGGRSWI
jgi:hypothetical protein